VLFVAERVHELGAVGSVHVFGRECGRARVSAFCHSVRRALRTLVSLNGKLLYHKSKLKFDVRIFWRQCGR
jgi:hypothetical protein